MTMICTIYRLARSSVYATLPGSSRGPTGKRGPKTRVSDAELVEEIRAVLAACPFHGEGYRKVRARLAHRGLHLGGKRPAPDAPPRPAGSAAPWAPAWRSRARRDHHHDPPR